MTNPTQPLIPRAKLFGNPTRAQAQISPDGRWLSWLAPKDGVLNIWLAPAGDIDAARAITNDRKRGIRFHGWAYDSTHVLYMQDEGGTEDWHIYAVDRDRRDARPDADGRRARPHRTTSASISPDIVVPSPSTTATSPGTTSTASTSAPASASCCSRTATSSSRIVLDRQLDPRLAPSRAPRRAASTIFRIDGSKLEPIGVVEHEDDLTTYSIGFTRDGNTLYCISSIGRDKAALLAIDWPTGKQSVLAEHPKADIGACSRIPRRAWSRRPAPST